MSATSGRVLKYKIEWKRSAEKEFSKIDKQFIPKIISAVEKLSNDPHPIYSKKLIGYENIYRLRVGNYRNNKNWA